MYIDIPDITRYKSKQDIEIVLSVYAWASNVVDIDSQNFYVVEDFVISKFGQSPYDYLINNNVDFDECGSFLKLLTFNNLKTLLNKLRKCYNNKKDLETYYLSIVKDGKYAHITLSEIFGTGTGFPTKQSRCCFYTYYLLIYWMQNSVWQKLPQDTILLPCSDVLLNKAYEKRIIKKDKTPTLKNAIKLTNLAKEKYDDMYLMLDYILK